MRSLLSTGPMPQTNSPTCQPTSLTCLQPSSLSFYPSLHKNCLSPGHLACSSLRACRPMNRPADVLLPQPPCQKVCLRRHSQLHAYKHRCAKCLCDAEKLRAARLRLCRGTIFSQVRNGRPANLTGGRGLPSKCPIPGRFSRIPRGENRAGRRGCTRIFVAGRCLITYMLYRNWRHRLN